jgi:hypothetical protein
MAAMHLVQEVWISYAGTWSTPLTSMIFSHLSTRKPGKCERRDIHTVHRHRITRTPPAQEF